MTKDIFDNYFKNLSAEELEVRCLKFLHEQAGLTKLLLIQFWKKRSTDAGAAHKAATADS